MVFGIFILLSLGHLILDVFDPLCSRHCWLLMLLSIGLKRYSIGGERDEFC